MSLSNLASQGQKALKEANSNNNSSGNFPKENIWFDWGNKEEQVAISQARRVTDGFLAEAGKADGAAQDCE